MSRERHVHVTRTTELPTKTYHITKHHFTPILYEPGVELIRRPTVEHKVITSGTGLSGTAGAQAHSGPRRKETIQIIRSPTVTYADVGGYGPRQVKKVVKVVGGGVVGDDGFGVGVGGGGLVMDRTTSGGGSHPESFVSMQRTMESELDRRRLDWEREVEKMQHGFFDLKASDASRSKLDDADLRPRAGEILTVGDSRELYHELPDGGRVYREKFDLYGFDTDNLSVRADDGRLVITASKEEADADGATSTRQFKRTVDIPDAVDRDQISSFLGDDGVLTIEAPLVDGRRREPSPPRIENDLRAAARRRDDFPPEFDAVVETTTSTATASEERAPRQPAPASAFGRRRYLGPDVEDTPYGRKLKTSLYIGRKYRPEDVTVRLYDYKINVDAKSEEVVAGRTSRRQFARDIDIPGPVERDTFRAMFGADGRLYLGGSFSGNEDHNGVMQSVEHDMPSSGKSVNIMF